MSAKASGGTEGDDGRRAGYNKSAKIIVIGGSGRVGGSTVRALRELAGPRVELVVGGRSENNFLKSVEVHISCSICFPDGDPSLRVSNPRMFAGHLMRSADLSTCSSKTDSSPSRMIHRHDEISVRCLSIFLRPSDPRLEFERFRAYPVSKT